MFLTCTSHTENSLVGTCSTEGKYYICTLQYTSIADKEHVTKRERDNMYETKCSEVQKAKLLQCLDYACPEKELHTHIL